ncbi:GntR family transcriptional regulator [Duganella violaceipulchra]|uniref:GntR family transcriptional regulator n=1 Tax=Duganella violaceipulchra TaxID=2849652 RepID=A0AA41H3Y8_9BURK|nr:GntR family transcriptional regulator [Duganella violaceicalia]MBV6320512.1 GntR family transcriptional regulator [Duganella violaceicalia]MCP2008780.1 DNA-binding GntR family transcriptional regulator [Duganella violaceicalia]
MPSPGKRKPRKAAPAAIAVGAPAATKRGTTAVDLRIYRAVVNAVMSHRLPPGTHLGEADFCELYQVSRTTVRKALQRLAHDHIIELRPNRGAVIASPTPEEARDIFAARRAIEREIVPLVIRNATPASLKQIRAALHAEDQARRTGDRAGWIRLGGEFHILLAELAGNQVLQRFMAELVSRCSLIIALYEAPGATMCENDEHQDLATLIEQGKIKEATHLIEHHLLEIEARLHLNEQDKKVNLAEALSGY